MHFGKSALDIPQPSAPTLSLPAGITISCLGAASSFGSNGCQDSLRLDTSNDFGVLEVFDLSASGGFQITNTTDLTFTGDVVFNTNFSAFYGGPEIGASITYPGVGETLGFLVGVSGTGVGDSHSCNTDGSGVIFSPYACGVEAPDLSRQEFLEFAIPGPGDSADYSEQINISASLFGVPNPPRLLYRRRLVGLGFVGRRRAVKRAL